MHIKLCLFPYTKTGYSVYKHWKKLIIILLVYYNKYIFIENILKIIQIKSRKIKIINLELR